jgi:type IV pilus assembly protein PilQ
MRTRIRTIPLIALLGAMALGSVTSADTSSRAVPAADAALGAAAIVDRATVLSAVEATTGGGLARITLRGNGRLEPRVVEEARDLPHRLLLDFPDVRAAAPSSTRVGELGVDRIRVAVNSHDPLVTRVVVDLQQRLPYRLERVGEGGRDLTIVLGDDAAPVAEAIPAIDTTTVAAPALVTTEYAEAPAVAPAPAVVAPDPAPPAVPVPVPVALAAVAAPEPAEVEASLPPASLSGAAALAQGSTFGSREAPQFSGHAITLDFQGVDLRAVLRTFAEVSELNLVIDPEVKGTVDVSLREVPWDQALDIILRANQLGYSTDGNVVRIAPLSRLRQEEEEKRKLQEARALSGELQLTTRTLNYAKAADVAPLLQNLLSSRGKASVDGRTNQIIIFDLPEYLERADGLIAVLDQAERQVEIEARIIVTRKSFARELGILWGFSGAMVPELGNTSDLAFPNRGVLSGGVNLPRNPLPSSTGVLDLALGSVNGAFNLDAALRALETEGKVRTLLTPRIVTQNNVRATVTRGQEIPYTTTVPTVPEGSGQVQLIQPIPTVQFKTAALTLAVTPRITAAGTVVLEVDVDNGSPGQAEQNGNRAINTQRAQTTVLVRDGATTVIGGIQGNTETVEEDSVPGLSKLPLIGRLFKNSIKSEEDEEILIFITPRIIEMQ